MFSSLRTTLTGLASFTLLAACASNPTTPHPVKSEPFKIQFRASVNGQNFQCGQSYSGVGTSRSDIRGRDFRFYISAPRLVTAEGTEIPISLTQDGKWQYQNLALLDFEDGSNGCEGNPDMSSQITGTIPAGSLKAGMGLRFELGVPFALNQGDASQAASPLNLDLTFLDLAQRL